MATQDSNNSQLPADDLRITFLYGGAVRFVGTSAQLVAEGLIPKNPKWPNSNTTANWNTEQFHFGVRRVKPEGMKDPKAEWEKLDNWELTRRPQKELSCHEAAIREKIEEIERINFRHSREGHLLFNKWWKAEQDVAFQAFRALIHGLVLPKRVRKPKETRKEKASNK